MNTTVTASLPAALTPGVITLADLAREIDRLAADVARLTALTAPKEV